MRPNTLSGRAKRLTLITHATIIAVCEAALDHHARRHDDGCPDMQYLQYLDTLGYQLSDVERLADGLQASESEL